ncbi:MAG: chromosomal replication initiator protein DnaA [Rikenellaceae bacterium]
MLKGNSKYDTKWRDCLEQIKLKTTEEDFVRWIKPIVPLEYDGDKLRLGVPNKGYVDKIEGRFINLLQPIIWEMYGEQTRICYAVPKSGATTTATTSVTPSSNSSVAGATSPHFSTSQSNMADIKNPFVIPGLRKINIDPNLNPNYRFENFIEGECNRLSRSAGLAVAENPGNNPFNPLYIYGNSGLGKTHIVQAVGHKIREKHPHLQVLYVSMNKFQSQFQTAYKNGEIPDFIHFYQTIDVLIIDDIQELTGKAGTQNAFFNIFNHLQLSGKQIILTSDKSPVELKDIEERLLTRFKWGFASQMELPNYETKYQIIETKAQRNSSIIPASVVEYLANNIMSNVREIEGALSAIVAHAKFLHRKVTIPLAREILKSYVQFNHKEINVEQIIGVVCRNFNISLDALNSAKRTRELAQARQIAMYLAKQHTKSSLSVIGAAVGGRNHSTVLHSCKAVTNLIETDKQFKEVVENITREILL